MSGLNLGYQFKFFWESTKIFLNSLAVQKPIMKWKDEISWEIYHHSPCRVMGSMKTFNYLKRKKLELTN